MSSSARVSWLAPAWERVRAADLGLAVARGSAFFFGVFSLASAVVLVRGAQATEDAWWIDLHFLPAWTAAAFALLTALLLLAWGVRPGSGSARRVATAAACVLVTVVACVNAVGFYAAWAGGRIAPWLPFPSSLLIAALFGWLARYVWRRPQGETVPRGNLLAAGAVVLLVVTVFPLVQIAFFGSTDYRRPADVAVVFGAKVNADGSLSTTLEDRVRTAADLYRSGEVRLLIMSGAVGETGLDEPTAMRDRALALGVPASAILLDHGGSNTDATVDDTASIFRRMHLSRVLAVSQFYHLPRIKMAYRAAGLDVQTVPAAPSRYIIETPWLVLREIPGFWTYWARAIFGT